MLKPSALTQDGMRKVKLPVVVSVRLRLLNFVLENSAFSHPWMKTNGSIDIEWLVYSQRPWWLVSSCLCVTSVDCDGQVCPSTVVVRHKETEQSEQRWSSASCAPWGEVLVLLKGLASLKISLWKGFQRDSPCNTLCPVQGLIVFHAVGHTRVQTHAVDEVWERGAHRASEEPQPEDPTLFSAGQQLIWLLFTSNPLTEEVYGTAQLTQKHWGLHTVWGEDTWWLWGSNIFPFGLCWSLMTMLE